MAAAWDTYCKQNVEAAGHEDYQEMVCYDHSTGSPVYCGRHPSTLEIDDAALKRLCNATKKEQPFPEGLRMGGTKYIFTRVAEDNGKFVATFAAGSKQIVAMFGNNKFHVVRVDGDGAARRNIGKVSSEMDR